MPPSPARRRACHAWGGAGLQSLLEHATDLIAVLDGDGVCRYLSPAYERILGYRPDDLLGHPFADIHDPDEEDPERRFFPDLGRRPGAIDRFETRLRHRDGSPRWMEVVAANRLADPSVGGIVVNARDVTERKSMEATTHQREQEQAALLRVSQAATASLDLTTVMAEVARACLGVGNAECCAVELWHPETDETGIVANETVPDWVSADVPGARYPLEQWPTTRRVLTRRQPLCFEADAPFLAEAERRTFDDLGVRSVLLVPLLVGDTCLGMLNLDSRHRHAFSAHEMHFAEDLARQAALVVQNTRLLAEAQQRAQEQAALLKVSQAFVSDADLSAILAGVCRAALGVAGAECCGIDVWHPGSDETEGVAEESLSDWSGVATPGHRYALADWPTSRSVLVERTARRFLVDDPSVSVHEQHAYAADGVRSAMMVPLLVGTACLGKLNLYSRSPRPFPPRAVPFGQELAAQAAQAIDRARLAAAQRRQQTHTDTLLRVAATLNEVGSLERLMPALAATAAEAVGVDCAEVHAYDGAAVETVASGYHGVAYGAEYADAVDGLPPHKFPAEAEVIRTRQPLFRGQNTAFPPPFPPPGRRTDLVVPLVAADVTQGVLYVWQTDEERFFTADEVALLQAMGHQAGLAILRARDAAAAERRADHLALLNQVGLALASSLKVEELCAIIHAEVSRVLAADAFFVALVGKGEEEIWFPYIVDQEWVSRGRRLRLTAGPTWHVIQTHRAYLKTRDPDPITEPGLQVGYRTKRSESALFVPMLRGDDLIGVLSVQRYDPGAYDEDDQRTLGTIAQQAAAALALAQLHADTIASRDAATRHAADLEAVLTITRSLASAPDLVTMLDVLANELTALVPHEVIAPYRVTADGARLCPTFSRDDGVDFDASDWTFDVGQGLVGHAFVAGEAELVNNAHVDPRSLYARDDARYRAEGQHVMVAPLVVASHVVGVLLLSRVGETPFTPEEFSVFRVLTEHAAAAIRHADLLSRNRELYLVGVKALVSAVDAKDPLTHGHSERVGRLAGRIAVAMGLNQAEAEAIELAGLLHDIGKIGVPDGILQKPGPLDDAERAIMVEHAATGGNILISSGADTLQPLVPLVRHHHERIDGHGYPDRLRGDAIPLGATIIACVDAFDTMVTARPYRPARPLDEAIAELRRTAGSQFRPDVVEALAEVLLSDESTRPTAPGVLAASSPGLAASDPDSSTPVAGQMGDTRALGLLVELAGEMRHIPDLPTFLARVTDIVRRRLGYQDVMLMLIDRDRDELALAAYSGIGAMIRSDYRQPLDIGVLGEVVRTGRPRNVPDVQREPRYHSERSLEQGSELAVPLIVEDHRIGVINVESDRIAAFTAADEAVLTAVAGQVAVVVHVAQLHDAAKRAATTDGLTGLANHRAFYDALTADTAAGRPLSVVLMDVEGLKEINDAAGHLAGDTLLRRVGEVVSRAVRAEDVVARYGGDEFAVIMRGAGGDDASRVAAEIRRELLEDGSEEGRSATVRYGVATLPDDGTQPTTLVAVADQRLYAMRDHDVGGNGTDHPLPRSGTRYHLRRR